MAKKRMLSPKSLGIGYSRRYVVGKTDPKRYIMVRPSLVVKSWGRGTESDATWREKFRSEKAKYMYAKKLATKYRVPIYDSFNSVYFEPINKQGHSTIHSIRKRVMKKRRSPTQPRKTSFGMRSKQNIWNSIP